MPSRMTAAPRNVIGSLADTPYSRLASRRVNAIAPPMPTATPMSPSFSPWPTMLLKILPRGAPSATRIPISCVRRVTASSRRLPLET
jgi:hypothetical protein